MLPTHSLIAIFGGFICTGLLVLLVREVAAKRHWVAVPNSRSSHTVPTATVGGIGFVIPILTYLTWLGIVFVPHALPLMGALALVAAVSLADDLREMSRRSRFVVHLAAVGLVVFTFREGMPYWVLAVAAFALLWHLNLYNFMDGIDGIAASQALFFCVGLQIVADGNLGWMNDLVWLLAGSMVGYLVYNWPKASIFMGDVGSGFIGLLIGAIVLERSGQTWPLVGSLILLAVFWFDATYTLCVRMLTGQPFTDAHRSHLYQKLAAIKGHRWTMGLFWAFALFWLLPLAWLASRYLAWSLVALAAAVAPIAVAAVWFRAGIAPVSPVKEEGSANFA
ncbi:MAG: glycosyltransferase family 4 protein [Proteobacteria bacterium]|nr:glycosyltransferase family 4 protein [Pseudomonadota bacterium]